VSTDVVVDTGTAGVDTVISQATFTLGATIENLVLTGANAINGTGNGLDNILTGNEASNILNGGLGADTMYGGGGNDTYVVDNYFDIVFDSGSGDTDSVQSSVDFLLVAGIENLTLTGSKAVYGHGNEEDNVIVGNSADNMLYGDLGDDTVDGGLGNDKLYGGAGNDTYVVNAAGDVITEDGVGDIDSVKASASYALGDNLENLTLTGTAAINGTGNELDNWIMGNSGNNVLNGGDGNDTLHGWTGQDKLYGGNGSDFFVVNSTGDMVYDNGASTDVDTVKSFITYTLGSTIEDLLLAGAATINGTGNASANWMIGNTANNKLTSLGGNDTLDGGLGNDTMTGGTGSDTFVKHSIAEGLDTITDFQVGWGADVLDIANMLVGYDSLTSNINDFVNFASSGKNTTVMIDVDGTGTDAVFVDSIILTGVNNISVDLMLGLGNLVAGDPTLVA
jgi:Ca2+-binding RTX toxin-like protein